MTSRTTSRWTRGWERSEDVDRLLGSAHARGMRVLPVRGRVLVRASRPAPEAPALVDAVTLAGPDAAVVELVAD